MSPTRCGRCSPPAQRQRDGRRGDRVEIDAKRLQRQVPSARSGPSTIEYDTLIVAAGSSYSYFGHDELAAYAHEVKTLESAVTVRSQILRAFERAEWAPSARSRGRPDVRRRRRRADRRRDGRPDRRTRTSHASPATFATSTRTPCGCCCSTARTGSCARFPPSLSARGRRALERLGVTVMRQPDGGRRRRTTVSSSRTEATTDRRSRPTRVIWAAGVNASGLAGELGAPRRRRGRSQRTADGRADLTMPGHPEVIVLGDMVRVRGRKGEAQELPGVAPVAIQRDATRRQAGHQPPRRRSHRPFHYRDKGNLATIGRGSAVVDLHGAAQRPDRVARLARRPPLLPDRLPQPLPGVRAMVVQLLQRRPRLVPDRGPLTYSPGPTTRMRSEKGDSHRASPSRPPRQVGIAERTQARWSRLALWPACTIRTSTSPRTARPRHRAHRQFCPRGPARGSRIPARPDRRHVADAVDADVQAAIGAPPAEHVAHRMVGIVERQPPHADLAPAPDPRGPLERLEQPGAVQARQLGGAAIAGRAHWPVVAPAGSRRSGWHEQCTPPPASRNWL